MVKPGFRVDFRLLKAVVKIYSDFGLNSFLGKIFFQKNIKKKNKFKIRPITTFHKSMSSRHHSPLSLTRFTFNQTASFLINVNTIFIQT
jgi:hypothetical protein